MTPAPRGPPAHLPVMLPHLEVERSGTRVTVVGKLPRSNAVSATEWGSEGMSGDAPQVPSPQQADGEEPTETGGAQHACSHAHFLNTCVCMCVHVYVCACVHGRVCTCVHVCACAHTHAQMELNPF